MRTGSSSDPALPVPGYAVRPITDRETLRRCEDLQMAVWGMGDRETVPFNQLLAATAAGGLVIGAFDAAGALVGFAYAFPGYREGRPLWYSHMTGVLPAHRGRGLGLRLKCAQRDAALAAGVERIVWTYDPLQAANARFNVGRLGVVASRYHVDYYGAMTDAINEGLPSDRLEVDWWLRSPRVAARIAAALAGRPRPPRLAGGPWALAATGAGSLAPPGPPALDLSAPAILAEIPPDVARLKREAPATAVRWREATRAVLRHYFGRGYAVTEAGRYPGEDGPRAVYLLTTGGNPPAEGGAPA